MNLLGLLLSITFRFVINILALKCLACQWWSNCCKICGNCDGHRLRQSRHDSLKHDSCMI
jgi:hypothetical protein